MTQYYILKPNIVNRDNLVKYTGTMQKIAEEKAIIKIKREIKHYGIDALSMCIPNGRNSASSFNYYFLSLKEWIEPAPEHLVVAARLRGKL